MRVKRAATSGKAALRAAASSLEDVTGFQVTLYSPASSSSRSPMWALITSRMPSASAWASSINCWSWRSSRIFISSSVVLMVLTSLQNKTDGTEYPAPSGMYCLVGFL